ncbi:MAG: sulfatase [Planctomycetota bacterium]
MNMNLDRRDFFKTLGLLSLAGCATPAGPGRVTRSKRQPNIVFILIDDLGWKDAGFMGSEYYETPNIDGLAKKGVVFTDAYANAPNCAPTRASLLTGQYTPRHGIYTVGSSERGPSHLRKLIPIPNKTVLDPDTTTLAEALRAGGYVCGHIGKWHLGKDPFFGPIAQGFDKNIGGGSQGTPPAGYLAPFDLPNLEKAPQREYLTDRLTDEALGFMAANRDCPFFLYLSHYAVHTPIRAKAELKKKYENKKGTAAHNHAAYAAMIENVDQSVGRVLAELSALGLSEHTAVFFFSDNGGHLGFTSMAPLRGGKGMLYEGGIREPLIISWTGTIAGGRNVSEPVIGTDFYPTILEMAGLPRPEGHVLDGRSLMPILQGDGSLDREAIYWHFPAYLERSKGVKGPWRTTPAGAVRKGAYKLIEFFEDGRLELYDLEEDRGETRDLSGTLPDKTRELHRLLEAWRADLGAPVPGEKNPDYDPSR